MKFRVFMLSLTSLAPMAALCDDAPPPDNVWTGKGQAGYVASQGNSEAKSANAAIDMALLEGPWKHAFHLGGLYGQSAGITSAERWDALWQSNYSFSKELFGFGNLRYAHDLFSGFQYQATGSVGAGYKFIDDATTKLDAQLGVGYRRLRPELLTKNAAGAVIARTPLDSQSGAVLTGGFNYSDALTDTTTLSNKFLFETGSSDTLLTDTLALTLKVSTKLALSIAYTLQDNTKPPAGLKKTDTLETINLVYAF